MLQNYVPILLFLICGVLFGGVLVGAGFIASSLLGNRRPDAEKQSPYECGFDPFENTRRKFDVRYYLVAIIFIMFDLETAFLFPWAVSLHRIGLFGFFSMLIFLVIVMVVGYIYEWKKGALEWE
jgi:NADH-quinone oxidoreductase subunit A